MHSLSSNMVMTLYVVGLAFTADLKRVALIHKKHGPKVVLEKWNGVGGHVEPDESPEDAMVREFGEETGLFIPKSAWGKLGLGTGPSYYLHFFCTAGESTQHAHTKTDEEVLLHEVAAIRADPEYALAPNIRWLIELAIKNYTDEPLQELSWKATQPND